MKWFWILVVAGSLLAADGPHLFYSKSFPGSTPAYVEITLSKNGDVAYREALCSGDFVFADGTGGEATPRPFRLSSPARRG